jgi:FkbM family methyltransferase
MSVQGASKAVVFEPLPQNAPRIRKLIELNPDLPLEFVPAAAGEHDGQTTFVIMDATSMGKLSNSTFQSDTRSDNEITVDVVSLDSWCETNAVAHPDLMKIDVEGAKIMVLRGAMGILKSRKPRLFIEAHSRELTTEVVDLLRPLGYKVTALETAQAPDGKSEPPVCHLVGVANEH